MRSRGPAAIGPMPIDEANANNDDNNDYDDAEGACTDASMEVVHQAQDTGATTASTDLLVSRGDADTLHSAQGKAHTRKNQGSESAYAQEPGLRKRDCW